MSRTKMTVRTSENQGPGMPKLPALEGFDPNWRYFARRVPGGGWMWVESFLYDGAPLVGEVSKTTFTTAEDAIRDADRFYSNHRHIGVLTDTPDAARTQRYVEAQASWEQVPARVETGRITNAKSNIEEV